MFQFKVTTIVDKIDASTGKTIQENIVDTTTLCDRREGNDGYEFRVAADGAERDVNLSELDSLTYLRIESVWAESDSASDIVEGKPAPLEFQISGGVWFSTTCLELTGESSIAGLKLRNSHESGKSMSVRQVAAGG